jgi:hypothetical protein
MMDVKLDLKSSILLYVVVVVLVVLPLMGMDIVSSFILPLLME